MTVITTQNLQRQPEVPRISEKCTGKWLEEGHYKDSTGGVTISDWVRWFSCEESDMCELHGCANDECNCYPDGE